MAQDETKPLKRLKHSLTSSNIWLYILSLINKRNKVYAYELDNLMDREFAFKPNKVMIYVVLYKLEAERIIESKFKDRRKYYTLTKKGKGTLKKGKEYLKKLEVGL